MREISSDVTFEVPMDRVASVRVTRSTRLTVKCGAVWLTRSDDVADYWLEPGHTLRLRRGERLWIGAEGGKPAWVAFALPVGVRQQMVDVVTRAAARLGVHAGDGWRTV
ncbi:DUF2917 domain-containing protein [Paraburkholderia dinghuensis]|uniref:DUF2917 domain-containing protein n=1 Tax=Paraburkholderia dinghuensis TaxID=2305225 RepID=A0A3N6N932_9BURK|nr:DUF2917 domain-containing protein [Paraburkholderia dinghuensis]RQH04677.1 DUF2917 domain-containing protein [Paraburkholderia dinghuensis]